MTNYSIICPFLTDDPMFAFGVEFGLLFARMRSGEERIGGYFCRQNQDRILLLAGRLGWHVEQMQAWDKDWFWCALGKKAAPVG